MNNNPMHLVNFYGNDDHPLVNIDNTINNPGLQSSGNKKNQLTLQSNKSTGKILSGGYAHTLSTH